jgi:hypothetical protein
MSAIYLHGTTPEELTALIAQAVNVQLSELKESLSGNPDQLMTREEACKFLSIDSSTLWHWTNKGKVIAYGIANRRYYKKNELLEALIPLKTK